jgi:hypothetical protein
MVIRFICLIGGLKIYVKFLSKNQGEQFRKTWTPVPSNNEQLHRSLPRVRIILPTKSYNYLPASIFTQTPSIAGVFFHFLILYSRRHISSIHERRVWWRLNRTDEDHTLARFFSGFAYSNLWNPVYPDYHVCYPPDEPQPTPSFKGLSRYLEPGSRGLAFQR